MGSNGAWLRFGKRRTFPYACRHDADAGRTMKLIGVDIGGTFTDVVFADTATDELRIHKVPTTPDDPSLGMLVAVRELCRRENLAPAEVGHLFHGTTIATNAILTHDGARTGMITNEGYRDIVHIGRHQRPQHYSIRQEIPWQDRPFVRRRHRLTVPERITPPAGEVLVPLDEEAVRCAARRLRDEGVEAIAVCFLFSWIDPVHEERAAAIVREEHPDCFVTTSVSVSPQFREFERFTTTAMNAFIGPRVRDYMSRIGTRMEEAGVEAELHVMSSNGGVATVRTVSERPVVTLLSGPAAGVLGGRWTGALSGRRRLITFDMGGTSADIGIVDDGRIAEATARDTWIAGYPVLVSMIDIHTIGAGGGSIARIDRGGGFRVGPESAGAVPGPAAYGRGGTEPTVTDANVVLGRLDRDYFLGGAMALDEGAAVAAVGRLAQGLGIGEREAAEGVLAIVNANMANAISSRTVQKGVDPREFSLVAFGGAGPLHAVEVATRIGIPEVIVPPYPGITSAVGLLTTELRYDAVRTQFQVSGALDLDRLNRDLSTVEASIATQFRADGLEQAAIAFERSGDLRYVGQGYELRVPFPAGAVGPAEAEDLFRSFHEQHRVEYGHVFEASPIEIVNVRVAGVGRTPTIGAPSARAGTSLGAARVRTGHGTFRTVDGSLAEAETTFYLRDRLPIGETFSGPAVVLQRDSTTVVPPGSIAFADPAGNLIITIEDSP